MMNPDLYTLTLFVGANGMWDWVIKHEGNSFDISTVSFFKVEDAAAAGCIVLKRVMWVARVREGG